MKKTIFVKILIIKILIIILSFTAIAVSTFFILKACGFTTKEDFLRLRNELGSTFWIWLIIFTLQIIQVIFIPISNQIITVPCALVFNDELWKVWLTSWLSIWVATLTLYALGRWGGEKILKWLLKDEEMVKRCTRFLKRGWVFFPLGMLLPLPDDIVTVLAGTGKMNFWFVAVCSLFTRAIDVACSVWGWGYLTRYWWGWIILAVGIIILGTLSVVFWKWQKR